MNRNLLIKQWKNNIFNVYAHFSDAAWNHTMAAVEGVFASLDVTPLVAVVGQCIIFARLPSFCARRSSLTRFLFGTEDKDGERAFVLEDLLWSLAGCGRRKPGGRHLLLLGGGPEARARAGGLTSCSLMSPSPYARNYRGPTDIYLLLLLGVPSDQSERRRRGPSANKKQRTHGASIC